MKYFKFIYISILALFIQNVAISQKSIEGPIIICPASDISSDNYVAPPAYFIQNAHARSQAMPVTSNIVVTYLGFEEFEEAKVAFQYAVDIWSTLIKSDITIYIRASYEELDAGVLGSAGTASLQRDFQGAPKSNTWYALALAEKLSKTNINEDGVPDINARFNSDFNWYLGTDGNPASGQYDFATVVLHEIGHGLGFADYALGVGEETGTGTNLNSGFSSIYTFYIQDSEGNKANDFTDGSTELGDFIVSNDLFINAPLVVLSNSDENAKIYAPTVYDGGSSISHWDDATFDGTSHALMTHAASPGEAIHHPGAVTMSLFAQLGWVHTFLEHVPSVILNSFTEDIIVNVEFSSDTTMTTIDAELHYSFDDFSTETVVSMIDDGNGIYSYDIPNPGIDAVLNYYISGFEDVLGRDYFSPQQSPEITHSTIIRNAPLLSVPFLLADGGDFESESGFYSIPLEGDVDIWEKGEPTGTLETATSGTNVWKTDLDANLTRPDENYSSALITPTYDLKDEIAHYELKFNLRMDIPADFLNVGLNVLYSIDGGDSFEMLGNVNDGLGANWYNLQNLNTLFSIGGDGWLLNNATANEALKVSYNLSSLAGSEVIFALVAHVRRSADDVDYDVDGILIDDFEITKTEPQAQYYISGSKINFPGNEVQFNFASSGADTYLWDFGDGSASSDLKNPIHSYNSGGDFDVTLTITYPGGTDTKVVEKGVLIISNKGSSYSLSDGGDFESNISDFLVDNVKGTKFELGKSEIAGKEGTVSGNNAWVTGLTDDEYANQSEAFLYTPLFDLKFLGDYQLSFNAKYSFESGWDGFILEYTIDSAKTWSQLIPSVQDDWYDREAVQDNTVEGWPLIPMFTGTTSGAFVTKSISLNSLSGTPSVGFRFHFKSDFLETDIGLALDDFQVTAPDFGAVVSDFAYTLDDGCIAEEVEFTNESMGGIISAFWDFGENATPSTATGLGDNKVVYDTAGTKVVTLTLIDENGDEFISTKTFELGELHTPTITSNGLVEGLILTASDADLYQWYLEGAAIDGAINQSLEAPSNGRYSVKTVVNGCEALSDRQTFITASSEELNKSITIAPNPTSNRVSIKHESNILIEKVSLLDLNGKLQMMKLNSDFLDFKNLNSGLYILKIETSDGAVIKKVFIE